MIYLIFATLFSLQAQTVQSDCSPVEQKVLLHPEFIKQFVLQGSLSIQDCTPIKVADKELLLINVVANTTSGVESYISLFERKEFSEKAAAVFKSAALGFDTFPVLVKNVQRLVFVHPSSDASKMVIFMSIQTGPAVSRLSRWEFVYAKKELIETGRNWHYDAGIIAKIYNDKETWRALIAERSVEL